VLEHPTPLRGAEKMMAFAFESPNVRVERPSNESAILLLDTANRPVNVFNHAVFADLEGALGYLAAEKQISLIFVQSAKISKPIAGADIQEFARIDSAEEAHALSALGQRLFTRLAELPAPTIIVVKGPCLGGGLEFALACDYRLVIDDPKTQLGLPEVELGIIPGWGGTQRLPRRIGLERALKVILAGKRLNAHEALAWGLADAVVSGSDDCTDVLRRLGSIATVRGKRPAIRLPLRGWRQRLLESTRVGRSLLFRGAAQVLARRVPDDMPAPVQALEAVRIGLSHGMEAGLKFERESDASLMNTPACRNLIGLFLAREKVRKLPASCHGKAAKLSRIGVVGAGTMGAGITQLAILNGMEVVIREIDEAALAAGLGRVRSLIDKAVERRLLTRDVADQKLKSLRGTVVWDGFDQVELVVEAAVENLSLKQEIFRQLALHTTRQTILASNTSSLLLRNLVDTTIGLERVAGLHFFNPVHKMPLVEVVQLPETSEGTLATCVQWAIEMGKSPVAVKDSPGFVVNRILAPYVDEALKLLAEGMPVERVDQAMRRFGMVMGPLEMLDQVGLDVVAHVARAMQPFLGRRFPANDYLEKLQARGWLGYKSGIGFYHYHGKKKSVNKELARFMAETGPGNDGQLIGALPQSAQSHEARERMVLLMVNEAAACLAESLAENASAIDLAMVLGTGWAPHRGGPLNYLKTRGSKEIARALLALAQRLGPRFEPQPSLREPEMLCTGPG
jgi:3-hydroxyacyl-CoA dehydrogenase/enoyl-CoA hydratase/3-hydroxybutyryl-CoA epimerase